MRVKTQTWIGVQCPICGKIQVHQLSAFQFAGAGKKSMLCNHCGQAFAALESVKGKPGYQLQIACMDCAAAHSFSVGQSELWKTSLREFLCPHTEEPILFVGEHAEVEALLEELFALTEEDFYEDEDAAAMREFIALLEHMKKLESNGLLQCICGKSEIQLQTEEGYLYVLCENCGRRIRFDISTQEKMIQVQSLDEIILK